jgi:hypothetical protein
MVKIIKQSKKKWPQRTQGAQKKGATMEKATPCAAFSIL